MHVGFLILHLKHFGSPGLPATRDNLNVEVVIAWQLTAAVWIFCPATVE
jgi:hypothetical protein